MSSWLNLYINVDRIVARVDPIVEKSTRDHDCVPAMHRGQVRATPDCDYDIRNIYLVIFLHRYAVTANQVIVANGTLLK